MSRFTGTYSGNWKQIAKVVKDEADWHCIRCTHPHDPKVGRTLTVHHLDGRKDNNRWWNLAALCQACHLHIQAKVHMERIWMFDHSVWFRPYVAGYYAFHYGFPDDTDFCSKHETELIAVGQGRMSRDVLMEQASQDER